MQAFIFMNDRVLDRIKDQKYAHKKRWVDLEEKDWLELEDSYLELFVNAQVSPASWGLFKDHIDFHVNLDEIEEVMWNIEALRIHIIMRKVNVTMDKSDGAPRGDVMASFKRDRTMRRFLFFCREKGVRMLKQTTKVPILPPQFIGIEPPSITCGKVTNKVDREELDHRWQMMQSDLLPDVDDRGESNKHLLDFRSH
ncbi:hypothetical protein NW759_017117 [Fusarium solani]|nr:hypothetical protein NW759_017117 [Fusarium solani]